MYECQAAFVFERTVFASAITQGPCEHSSKQWPHTVIALNTNVDSHRQREDVADSSGSVSL